MEQLNSGTGTAEQPEQNLDQYAIRLPQEFPGDRYIMLGEQTADSAIANARIYFAEYDYKFRIILWRNPGSYGDAEIILILNPLEEQPVMGWDGEPRGDLFTVQVRESEYLFRGSLGDAFLYATGKRNRSGGYWDVYLFRGRLPETPESECNCVLERKIDANPRGTPCIVSAEETPEEQPEPLGETIEQIWYPEGDPRVCLFRIDLGESSPVWVPVSWNDFYNEIITQFDPEEQREIAENDPRLVSWGQDFLEGIQWDLNPGYPEERSPIRFASLGFLGNDFPVQGDPAEVIANDLIPEEITEQEIRDLESVDLDDFLGMPDPEREQPVTNFLKGTPEEQPVPRYPSDSERGTPEGMREYANGNPDPLYLEWITDPRCSFSLESIDDTLPGTYFSTGNPERMESAVLKESRYARESLFVQVRRDRKLIGCIPGLDYLNVCHNERNGVIPEGTPEEIPTEYDCKLYYEQGDGFCINSVPGNPVCGNCVNNPFSRYDRKQPEPAVLEESGYIPPVTPDYTETRFELWDANPADPRCFAGTPSADTMRGFILGTGKPLGEFRLLQHWANGKYREIHIADFLQGEQRLLVPQDPPEPPYPIGP